MFACFWLWITHTKPIVHGKHSNKKRSWNSVWVTFTIVFLSFHTTEQQQSYTVSYHSIDVIWMKRVVLLFFHQMKRQKDDAIDVSAHIILNNFASNIRINMLRFFFSHNNGFFKIENSREYMFCISNGITSKQKHNKFSAWIFLDSENLKKRY